LFLVCRAGQVAVTLECGDLSSGLGAEETYAFALIPSRSWTHGRRTSVDKANRFGHTQTELEAAIA